MCLQNLQAEFVDAMLINDQSLSTISPAMNIQIYHRHRLANLIHALQTTYPMVVKLLGKDFFSVMAKKYVNAYPAQSGNLHEYGEYFSDFLSEQAVINEYIYLVEVAHFEWLCHKLFFAPDHPCFDIKKLEKIPPDQFDQLHFMLHPASYLLKFHYPILNILKLCEGKLAGPLDVSQGGVNLLIIRRQLDICLVPLTESEFVFLNLLNDAQPISAAVDATLNTDQLFKLDDKLLRWIKDNTIVDCYLHYPSSP